MCEGFQGVPELVGRSFGWVCCWGVGWHMRRVLQEGGRRNCREGLLRGLDDTPADTADPSAHLVARYDTRKDIKFEKDAPVIGLVLQRSHLVTGDAGHYDGVVSGESSRGI